MGHHGKKRYLHMEVPEEDRERDIKRILKNNGWKLFKYGDRHGLLDTGSLENPQKLQSKEIFTETHFNHTQKSKTKKLERAKRKKKTHHIQRNPSKAIRKFLSRNLTGQERVGLYIQSVQRKNCQPKILYPAKLSFRNKRVKDLPRQSWGNLSLLDLSYKK